MGGGLAVVEVGGRGGRSFERYSDEDEGGRGRAEEEEPFSERVSSEVAELREDERCSVGKQKPTHHKVGNYYLIEPRI